MTKPAVHEMVRVYRHKHGYRAVGHIQREPCHSLSRMRRKVTRPLTTYLKPPGTGPPETLPSNLCLRERVEHHGTHQAEGPRKVRVSRSAPAADMRSACLTDNHPLPSLVMSDFYQIRKALVVSVFAPCTTRSPEERFEVMHYPVYLVFPGGE